SAKIRLISTGRKLVQMKLSSEGTKREAGSCTYFLSSDNPHYKISQAVSCQNHPSVSNPARTNNVTRRQQGNRCDHCTVHSPAFRNPNPATVTVSDLRRNLVAFFSPRLEVAVRKFC